LHCWTCEFSVKGLGLESTRQPMYETFQNLGQFGLSVGKLYRLPFASLSALKSLDFVAFSPWRNEHGHVRAKIKTK